MKKIFKKIILIIFNFLLPALNSGASILMYHSVGYNRAFFTVRPDNFDRQLAYLKKRKLEIIKLSDLISRFKNGQNINGCVCLTFDDGYLDNLTEALPILEKYNFPATIFVTTGLVGRAMTNSEGVSLPIVSEQDIRSTSNLLEFMPHTTSHSLLNTLSPAEYSQELLSSQEIIKWLTGGKGDILAYPKGRYGESVINYLKTNNWAGAVTVEEGLVSRQSDLYKLNRNGVYAGTILSEFKLLVSNRLKTYLAFKRKIKSFIR